MFLFCRVICSNSALENRDLSHYICDSVISKISTVYL